MNQLNFDGISFNADYAAGLSQADFIADAKANNPALMEKWAKKSPEDLDKALTTVHGMATDLAKSLSNDNSGGNATEIPAGEPTGDNGGRSGGEPEAPTGLQPGATARTGRGQSGKETDKV